LSFLLSCSQAPAWEQEKSELAFIELLVEQGIGYLQGKDIERDDSEVFLKDDYKRY